MKVSRLFEAWKKDFRSAYNTAEGVDLCLGPFHHGTTFEADIQLEKDDEEELRSAIKNGFTPVWATLNPD